MNILKKTMIAGLAFATIGGAGISIGAHKTNAASLVQGHNSGTSYETPVYKRFYRNCYFKKV